MSAGGHILNAQLLVPPHQESFASLGNQFYLNHYHQLLFIVYKHYKVFGLVFFFLGRRRKYSIIYHEIMTTLPSAYMLNLTTSCNLHCIYPMQGTVISHLGYCNSLFTDGSDAVLALPLHSKPKNVPRVILLK